MKMIRQIIRIDEDKCNGCGLCAEACHEGAIAMVGGKAKLLRDDYCDGLGDCLPLCPTGAISFERREALPYDEEAVMENMKNKEACSGCPSAKAAVFTRPPSEEPTPEKRAAIMATLQPGLAMERGDSALRQWPVQIKLAPVKAPFYHGAKLLIAADCTAYSYGNFHKDFMEGHVTLIGCPKLDEGDYSEKLTTILKENEIKEVHLVRMEVPCCGGLERVLYKAMEESKKVIPWHITTLTTAGTIKK